VVGPTSSSFTSLHFCFFRNFDFAFLKFRMTTMEGNLMQASAKRWRSERGQQHTAVQSAAAPAMHLHIPVFFLVLVPHSSSFHWRSPSNLQALLKSVPGLMGDLLDAGRMSRSSADYQVCLLSDASWSRYVALTCAERESWFGLFSECDETVHPSSHSEKIPLASQVQQ